MSELRTNKIVPRDGLPLSASGGGIIQVVSVTKTDAESLASTSTPQLIPGMQATITPQSASNKILVMICLHAAVGGSYACLLYTSPSPRDQRGSRMPSSA